MEMVGEWDIPSSQQPQWRWRVSGTYQAASNPRGDVGVGVLQKKDPRAGFEPSTPVFPGQCPTD